MKWSRNEAVEGFLKRCRVPFHWVDNLPFEEINRQKSLKNQARPIPLNEDDVQRYTIAMQQPDANFFGPVLYQNGKGKIAADGNHRCEAYDCAGFAVPGATIGAYILDTDDEMLINFVTRCLNQTNGRPQTKDEAVEQALWLLDNYPSLTQSDVATQVGVNQSTISQAVRARNTANALRERRVNPDRLSRTTLTELARLSHTEPAMAVAADIAIKNELGLPEVKQMVAAVKEQRSEAKQLAVLEKFETDAQRNKPKPMERRNTTKSQYHRAIHTLFGIVAKHPSLEHLQITSKSEIAEAKRDWEKLWEAMEKIFG